MKQSYAHCDLKQQWNATNISMIKQKPRFVLLRRLFFFLDQAVSVSRPHAGERLFLFKNSFSTISSCHRMQYLSWRDKFLWSDISFSFPYILRKQLNKCFINENCIKTMCVKPIDLLLQGRTLQFWGKEFVVKSYTFKL